MTESFEMIAKTFFGLEGVLADELASLGAQDVRPGRRMCSFRGDLSLAYRANLCCRVAVRILKPIHAFVAADEQALYRGVGEIDWSALLDADATLAVDPVVHGATFGNSLYAAQLAKDAIVDQFRTQAGHRPSVNLVDPDLRINLHINDDRVTVYLDASGDSLHKRGYRAAAGEAPINEVLAAGILRLTEWDAQSPLSDFMCGSGTLAIEAALAARRIAPGLIRRQFGYMRWKDFCRATHEAELAAARREVRPSLPFPLQASDLDAEAIAAARSNARRAGVEADIHWLVENFATVRPPAASGTLVTNPPYDERMKTAGIEAVYRRIGDALKQHWTGHTAFIFSGNLDAVRHIGLRASERIRLFNGPIECRLVKFDIFASPDAVVAAERETPRREEDVARAFGNRLARMAKHWQRRFRRQGVTAFRVYDRDIPEVPLAVDWYDGHLLVSEYRRPHARTEIEQRAWLARMVETIAESLAVPRAQVYVRARQGQRDGEPRFVREPLTLEIHEGPLAFEVHLGGSQETGLALDQRQLRGMLWNKSLSENRLGEGDSPILLPDHPTDGARRKIGTVPDGSRIGSKSPDLRVLNLFARTGTATVAMAAAGAAASTSVERSAALAAWAQRNLRLNGCSGDVHRVICQDPLEFVRQLDPSQGPQFDLAVVEPPGFDGKRREGVWNVQDGHVDLINRLLACLEVGGELLFVTTFRRLKLHAARLRRARVREITRQTVPPDFRNKKVHRAWSIVHTES